MGLLNQIINTFVQKAPDGKEYIRTVDIAPHGFDEVANEYKVRVAEKEKIKLLKSHLEYDGLLTNSTAYLGEDARAGSIQLLKPIDVSKHPKRTVVIYNHHDQPIKFRTALFYVDFEQSQREISLDAVDLEIPAFNTSYNIPGSLVIDMTKFPELNTGLPGMGLDIRQSTTAPTTGHIDVYVFGGK